MTNLKRSNTSAVNAERIEEAKKELRRLDSWLADDLMRASLFGYVSDRMSLVSRLFDKSALPVKWPNAYSPHNSDHDEDDDQNHDG